MRTRTPLLALVTAALVACGGAPTSEAGSPSSGGDEPMGATGGEATEAPRAGGALTDCEARGVHFTVRLGWEGEPQPVPATWPEPNGITGFWVALDEAHRGGAYVARAFLQPPGDPSTVVQERSMGVRCEDDCGEPVSLGSARNMSRPDHVLRFVLYRADGERPEPICTESVGPRPPSPEAP